MLIDKPLCMFKNCRRNFDGNCIDPSSFERCEYAEAIGMISALSARELLWENRAKVLADMMLCKMNWQCHLCANPMKNLEGPIVGCDGNCMLPDVLPSMPDELFKYADSSYGKYKK